MSNDNTKIEGLKINLDELETGDILLYGGTQFWFSRIIRWWTKSKWSHISIVLKNPTFIDEALNDGVYIWESGIENIRDAENNKFKFGVQINSLEDILKQYDGYVCCRKLHCDMSKEKMDESLEALHKIVHGDEYDTNPYDLMIATDSVKEVEEPEMRGWWIWDWFRPTHRRTNTYFCSALVGFVYTQLGLLPDTTRWSECSPEFFSSRENPNMKLIKGKLDDDKLIFQNPKSFIKYNDKE